MSLISYREFSLRKINSILVLLIILSLFVHALLSGLCLANLIAYTPNMVVTGMICLLFASLHIIISLYLYIRDRLKQRNIRVYNHINNDTVVQAISGFCIVVFVVLHILSYIYLPAHIYNIYWNIAHVIVDTSLVISLYVHLQLSIPRMLVSLGFLVDEGAYDKCQKYTRIILLICVIALFFAEISHYIL